MKQNKAYVISGLVLLAAYLLQDVFSLKWMWLETVQQGETYKQITGLLLFLYIAEQWYLSVLRVRGEKDKQRSLYQLHTVLGVLAPVFFYLHSTQFGYAYLFLLSVAYFSNLLVGLLHQKYWKIKWKRYSFYWMIAHVTLSVFVVILMGYHVFIAFYYS